MKEIIDWIIGIEDRAHKVYEKAAFLLKDDKAFADFLWHLAADEKGHYDSMCMAAEVIKGEEDYPSLVLIGDVVKQKIEAYFGLCEKRIEANKLTKENLIDFIAATEYSEWNDLFVYAVNILKHSHRQFIPAVVNMQQHRKYIERFLEPYPEFGKFLEKVRQLTALWQEQILVVDDDNAIVDLLKAILSDEGVIEGAVNGEEGLEKIGEKYFAAIVTDVDMPVMNGIEFYKKAVKLFPNVKDRFLFFTGLPDEERLSFFRENNLKFIIKPSPIDDIRKGVIGILSRRLK